MDRDIGAAAGREPVQLGADLGDRLVAPVHGGAQDRHHADRVLVALRGGLRAAQVQPVRLHRHQPRLHLPVAAELLPADLDVRAHDQVGPGSVGAGRAAAGPPAPQQRHPPEHAGLAGAGGGAAGRRPVLRRVPEAGQDVHAPRFQLRSLRVLVFVDHVLAEALGHQLRRLRLHPRGDERGQVEPGVAVQGQLVPHSLERRVGQQPVPREPVPGHREVQFADVDRVDLDLVLLLDLPVQCHAAPSLAGRRCWGGPLRAQRLRAQAIRPGAAPAAH